MTWIKICGNTSLADAQLSIDLGADALGFVFAESKRRVTPQQVAPIAAHLPDHVERVGVFYSRDAAEIATAVQQAHLTAVQLHGGLDLLLIKQLRERFGSEVRMIQTLHFVVGTDSGERLQEEIDEIVQAKLLDRVLVDSRVGNAGGGTGVAFDWKAARSVFQKASGNLRTIVAGGLRPDNVGEAIRELEPWGVDVASGVEASPGQKDPAKLRAFFEAARQ
ncbi:phosphoribosylanthranilate isomerase [Edaphobacter sp. HDX4]|uniref:phosphoribosylanthranilate isomerase n=1 Tax=Edaphobacter sp. HDX4 TaxID=2794064 RepID=UPI002FE52C39